MRTTSDWLEPLPEGTGVAKAEPKSFAEIGTTGLNRTSIRGVVDEEFLPELRGERGRKIFREMRENDATIGGFILAIETLVRGVKWMVEGENQEQVEFVESCMVDMSHTWEDLISEILSMLPYGWSWHEIVYKKRQGPQEDGGSRFTDGKIGWRKMPIRSQDSLLEWIWDDQGGVQAFVQSGPPDYLEHTIPINRSLLFRTGLYKGNPEGRSILRSAYRSWFFKKRVEEIEGIGIERDLAGLPVIYATKAVTDRFGTELKKILRNVRRDEQEGLIFPLIRDPEKPELKDLEFQLLSSQGQRQIDITSVIDRYDKRIAITVLADFLLLGQQGVGSYALSSDKTKLFTASLEAMLGSIAAVFNRYAIPRLLAVNGMPLDVPPELKYGEIDLPNLEALSSYVTALAGAGMPLFPDEELENHLREQVSWPQRPEDMDQRMAEQQRVEAGLKAEQATARKVPTTPPKRKKGSSKTKPETVGNETKLD